MAILVRGARSPKVQFLRKTDFRNLENLAASLHRDATTTYRRMRARQP